MTTTWVLMAKYDRNDPCVCRALVGLPTTASCQEAARRR